MRRLIVGLFLLTVVLTACGAPTGEGAPPQGGQPSGELVLIVGEHTVSYTLEALQALSAVEVEYHGRTYTGVRVRDLLEDAGADPGALSSLEALANDGYHQTLGPEAFLGDNCIVAYLRDGASLSYDEGPLRLIVSGEEGQASVKMLVRLTTMP